MFSRPENSSSSLYACLLHTFWINRWSYYWFVMMPSSSSVRGLVSSQLRRRSSGGRNFCEFCAFNEGWQVIHGADCRWERSEYTPWSAGRKNANRRFNGIRQDVDAVSQKGPPSAHFLGEACSGRLQSQVTSWRDCSESGTLPLESGGWRGAENPTGNEGSVVWRLAERRRQREVCTRRWDTQKVL